MEENRKNPLEKVGQFVKKAIDIYTSPLYFTIVYLDNIYLKFKNEEPSKVSLENHSCYNLDPKYLVKGLFFSTVLSSVLSSVFIASLLDTIKDIVITPAQIVQELKEKKDKIDLGPYGDFLLSAKKVNKQFYGLPQFFEYLLPSIQLISGMKVDLNGRTFKNLLEYVEIDVQEAIKNGFLKDPKNWKEEDDRLEYEKLISSSIATKLVAMGLKYNYNSKDFILSAVLGKSFEEKNIGDHLICFEYAIIYANVYEEMRKHLNLEGEYYLTVSSTTRGYHAYLLRYLDDGRIAIMDQGTFHVYDNFKQILEEREVLNNFYTYKDLPNPVSTAILEVQKLINNSKQK